MKLRALWPVLLLSACAGRLVPPGISGNAAYVRVSNVWNASEALPYATQHCSQFGKVPRMTHSEGYAVMFDCVSP